MTNNLVFWGVYIIFFGALIYFMAYRPQKKQREQQEALLSRIAVFPCRRLPSFRSRSRTQTDLKRKDI